MKRFYFLQNYIILFAIFLNFIFVGNIFAFELKYSTFLGSNQVDIASTLAVGDNGGVFVTGSTSGTTFPITSGAMSSSYAGDDSDSFISKFSNDLSTLEYSTYWGGNDEDAGTGIIVNNSNIVIAGFTRSTNFTTFNPIDSTYGGVNDIFISKFSISGNNLTFSTYLGGSLSDTPSRILENQNGDYIIVGQTMSNDFPIVNSIYNSFGGFRDAYFLRISNDGTNILNSSFLGGNGEDYAYDLAIDNNSNYYLTGFSNSSNFPTLNAYDSSYNGVNGGRDIFISKISSNCMNLLFSTYFGGSDNDIGHSIALDFSENIYVTGSSLSNNFPIISPVSNNSQGFAIKFTNDGSNLINSKKIGYITPTGITQTVKSYVMEILENNDVILIGKKKFFPYGIAFIILDSTLNNVKLSSLLTQGNFDLIGQKTCLKNGKMFLTGNTNNSSYSTTSNSYDESFNGAEDAFVTIFERFSMIEDVNVSLVGNDISLTWNSIPNAINYKIYKNTLPNYENSNLISTITQNGSTISYTDPNVLQNSNKFYYFVTYTK
ncbi:MAG: hypothetical protein DWQ06_12785 [Calditrichaeota bacterium]|nr:MAG: hypothetical protein DWQ06_12785 [Calditrichota bacterium]